MSQIEIRCVDQTAMFTNLPEIFSGDVNIDIVKFTFDDSWNGYTTKTAVFYNNPKDVYPQILDVNNIAVIPSQVMTKECKLSIGVFGTKANGDVKTSKILTYNVGKGAINSDLESTPATPDFWTQLLSRQINFENTINTKVDTFQTTVNSKVDGLETNVDTVEAIAKGRNQALAYNSYSEMITALNGMTKDELKRGQNIYIGTVGVPDLWVYGVETTNTTYTYTNDETFVSGLNDNVTVKVGYYKLAQLETQKVDVGGINASISELQSSIESVRKMLSPRPVTIVSAKTVVYLDGSKKLMIEWSAPNVYDIQIAQYNIYGYSGDASPTSIEQFNLITSVNSNITTYEASLSDTYKYILIASVSTDGIIQEDISYKCLVDIITLPSIGTSFSSMSWSDINNVIKYSDPQSYFKVGDAKSISIDGTSYNIKIYDFNHDDLADGSGKAKMTLGLANCLSTTYAMNSSNSNDGGWGSCALRATLQDTIFNQLPSELRALIKKVKKKTSAGNQSSTINTTEDTLFLFSEVELFGSTSYSKSGEGTKYPIFTNNSSRIKKQGDSGSACSWWERSPYASDSALFCGVDTDGSANYNGASITLGVCFGFCI